MASSRALIGWQFRMSTSSFVIVNAGAAGATVNLQHLLRSAATQSLDGQSGSATDESCSYYGSFPKALADLTRPGMMPTELGTLSGKCGTKRKNQIPLSVSPVDDALKSGWMQLTTGSPLLGTLRRFGLSKIPCAKSLAIHSCQACGCLLH